jgi:hypothetical protein
VGELPEDSETRGSQDRLVVNLAGAGRKSMSLSREVCRSAGVFFPATAAAMVRDGAAEVSRGHSTFSERAAYWHLPPKRRSGKGKG